MKLRGWKRKGKADESQGDLFAAAAAEAEAQPMTLSEFAQQAAKAHEAHKGRGAQLGDALTKEIKFGRTVSQADLEDSPLFGGRQGSLLSDLAEAPAEVAKPTKTAPQPPPGHKFLDTWEPAWRTVKDVEVLGFEGLDIVAVPSTGRRNARHFDIVDVSKGELLTQLRKEEVTRWFHQIARDRGITPTHREIVPVETPQPRTGPGVTPQVPMSPREAAPRPMRQGSLMDLAR